MFKYLREKIICWLIVSCFTSGSIFSFSYGNFTITREGLQSIDLCSAPSHCIWATYSMYLSQLCCVRFWASVLAVLSKETRPLQTTNKAYCENNPIMMITGVHAINIHLKSSKDTYYLNSSYDEKLIAKIVNETKILFRIIIYTC